MAGLLTPPAATLLVSALKKEFPTVPLHIHTHDTSGAGVASMLACAHAGADIVDCALDSMSGLTSQPSMGAIVASLAHTPLDTGITLESVSELSDYWEQVRGFYAPFDCTSTLKSGSSDVYNHEIPGGQYTNLHMQAWALGMASKWPEIKRSYAEANDLLGDIIKVTPSSKVVGDFAQFMVQNGVNKDNVFEKLDTLSPPTSVIEYFQGHIGQPPFGFPKELQAAVLKGKEPVKGRPGEDLTPIDWDATRKSLEQKHHRKMSEQDLVSSVMYPAVFDDYEHFVRDYGDVSDLPSAMYFTGMEPGEEITVTQAGREVTVKFITTSELHSDGTRDVFFEVMGLPRTVTITDKSATSNVVKNAKANEDDPKHIGAPMPGNILGYKVKKGDAVKKGQPLVALTAMKMETLVTAPVDGVVAELSLKDGDAMEAGDLLVRLE
jgi:pyruvate carboxylase